MDTLREPLPRSSSVSNESTCNTVAEKAMAPHSSTLAWKIPWTEEPDRLQSMGSLRDTSFPFSIGSRRLGGLFSGLGTRESSRAAVLKEGRGTVLGGEFKNRQTHSHFLFEFLPPSGSNVLSPLPSRQISLPPIYLQSPRDSLSSDRKVGIFFLHPLVE